LKKVLIAVKSATASVSGGEDVVRNTNYILTEPESISFCSIRVNLTFSLR
jgi:hypothetical protein